MWHQWWTKWRWDRFSPEYIGLPPHIHSTGVSLLGKMKKLITVVFVLNTGFHNKP
jgi:hypothetical protein